MHQRQNDKLAMVTAVTVKSVKPATSVVTRLAPPPSRKMVRLAATITDLEPERPRLPPPQATAELLDSVAWRQRWGRIRARSNMTSAYVAGCRGTMALGGRLGLPICKPGTAEDVPARIAKLNQQRYGSLTIRDFALVEEEGYGTWEPAKLSAPPCHPASPVRVLPRSLLIALPFWVTPQDFEALFNAALEPIALAHLAASSAGLALCRRRGCEPDELLRYSRGARGPVMATEIATFGPSADAGRLVALIEAMLVRIVLADDGGER